MKKNYHKTERVEFKSTEGETLAGRLEVPLLCEAKAYAIFAHCFTCTKDIAAATYIARQLAAMGIAVLRFDFTGLGNSEGDFSNTNFSSNVADLVKAAEFLSENYQAPSLIIGHSLGGAAVLAAVDSIPSIKAVATIGAPAEPAHVAQHFAKTKCDIIKDGEAKLDIGGREFSIKKQFLDDIEEQKLSDKIAALHTPLLILHSPIDNVVGIENAQKIYQAASHPKSFISLADADHLLSNSKDAEYVAETISSWAKRYLDITEDEKITEADKVVLSEVGSANFINKITAGGHEFIGDEPKSIGGADTGAAPYDFLLAGLGLCKAVTLRMYAERKGWDVENIQTELAFSREGDKEIIGIDVKITGDLDEEQLNKLHEISEKCPVQKTLNQQPEVRTKVTASN